MTCNGAQRQLCRTNSPLKLKLNLYSTEIEVLLDRLHISDQIWRGGRKIFSEMSEGFAQNAEIVAN